MLSFKHKEIDIVLRNETGTAYVGSVMSTFTTIRHSLEFELTTRSHFSRLFIKAKRPFTIKTSNLNLNRFLSENESLKKLEEIASATKFAPHIKGFYEGSIFKLKVDYHLEFSNWQQVIEPLFNFYKDFIDRFST